MRFLLLLLAVGLLVGCTGNQADFTRIGDRTFRIEGPPIAGGAEGPVRRVAEQVCQGGYRLLNQEAHKGGPDRADFREFNTTTVWVVKCL
jgi:hypothetical protein